MDQNRVKRDQYKKRFLDDETLYYNKETPFYLKEPQTTSIYWFYLLHNYVVMPTKSKQFVTYIFIWPKTTVYFSQGASFVQLRELVFFSCTNALIFLERHTRLFVEPAIWALLSVSLMTVVLVQSLTKMRLKCVFHITFRIIIPISWIKKHFH